MKKIISFVLAIVFTLSLQAVVFAETINSENINVRVAQIEALLEKRLSLLNISPYVSDSQNTVLLNSEIEEIDVSLKKLGASFLTMRQVSEQFPETKSDKTLAFSGNTHTSMKEGPSRITPPDSVYNTWITYNETRTYGGKNYNIQKLVVHPKLGSSPLYDGKTIDNYYDKSWTAGLTNVCEVLVRKYFGEIHIVNTALSWYDVIKAFVSGASSSTEVRAARLSYPTSNVTEVMFSYVRLESQSDAYQWLALVSTKTKTSTTIKMTGIKAKNENIWVTYNDQTKEHITNAVPDEYGYAAVAIAAFNDQLSGTAYRAVGTVSITVPDYPNAIMFDGFVPSFPLQCESN